MMEPEKTDRDAIVATVSDAPVEKMMNDDRDVKETTDRDVKETETDDSTENPAIHDLPTRLVPVFYGLLYFAGLRQARRRWRRQLGNREGRVEGPN